jgi:hypothetical protein
MYSSILFKHPSEIVLVHRPGHLPHEHLDSITVRLFLFNFDIVLLRRTQQIVVVTVAIIVVVVVRAAVVIVVHRQ